MYRLCFEEKYPVVDFKKTHRRSQEKILPKKTPIIVKRGTGCISSRSVDNIVLPRQISQIGIEKELEKTTKEMFAILKKHTERAKNIDAKKSPPVDTGENGNHF